MYTGLSLASSACTVLPREEYPLDLDVAGVKALQDGRKTACRVPMKRKPVAIIRPLPFSGQVYVGDKMLAVKGRDISCPFGRPGDLLYVREPFAETPSGVVYRADGVKKPEGARWRAPGRMPRAFSRFLLTVCCIYPERLSAIDGASAMAEGLYLVSHGMEGTFYSYKNSEPAPDNWVDPVDAYLEWWESMYGVRGRRKRQASFHCGADPWVYRIEFRRVDA